VLDRPALRRLLLLAALPVLLGMPYQSLMPATAARVFGVEASGLGALLSANGIGALIGSLVVAARTGSMLSGDGATRLRALQRASGVLLGGAVAAFGLVGHFWPALALVAIAGGAAAAYTAVNNTLLMHEAEREFHGRVMSVYMMAFSMMPLSAVPAAWVADRLGLPLTLAACGIGCAAIVALLGRVSPSAAGARAPQPEPAASVA
jgi:hypothetical protein